MRIITLTQGEAFQLARKLYDTESAARIAFDDDGVKVSIDRDMWTIGYGTEDNAAADNGSASAYLAAGLLLTVPAVLVMVWLVKIAAMVAAVA